MIEANILLTAIISGLGGSKFRAAVAHALLYGLSIHTETHRYLHGELAAFGIIVQLCLERMAGVPTRLIKEIRGGEPQRAQIR